MTVMFGQLAEDKHSGDSKLSEELLLVTDRQIYFTGEQVWLKIYKMNSISSAPSDISRIVYVELLDESNNPVTQMKVWIDDFSGSCCFRLPDTLKSDNYLIRAYTRWMQNYSVYDFLYKTISVINPFRDISSIVPPAGSQSKDTGLPQTATTMSAGDSTAGKDRNRLNIRISVDRQKFSTREGVKINVLAADASGKPVQTDLLVSVAKSFLADTTGRFAFESRRENILKPGSRDISLPEPEGEIIRGVIRNKATDEPLRNTVISLAFVGKNARCQFERTDDNGDFIFAAGQIYGFNEMVIQPMEHDEAGSYAELDQPFCNTFADLKPSDFYIDSSRIENINKAIISMQFNNQYEPFRQKIKESTDSVVMSNFFGVPSRRLLMKDFIELTDLREIIKELLPQVYVERKDKIPELKIFSNNSYESFQNPALVLADGIPVYDIEGLLKIKGGDIERIDIVDSKYYYHSCIFDGIVSIITKKGNLSSMDYDASVYRRVFEGSQSKVPFYSPDYSGKTEKESRIPDFRNTLYWNPDVRSDEKGNASVHFFTSDEKGEYIITVKGMNSEGICGSSSSKMQVE